MFEACINTWTSAKIFAYDGDNLIEQVNSSGAAVSRYAFSQNIDEPLAMLRSSTTSYFEADGLGSITSLSNSTGSATNLFSYDSFGNRLTGDFSASPFLFTGREYEPDIAGLYFYRARYYDPSTGRFLSEDPMRFQAGPNFYAYVQNQPTTFVDPFGLGIAVLEGGPTKGNPIGHTAICITGSGVYSFGNGVALGSSCTDYLKDQKSKRDTIIHVIHTTPAQDAAALAYLRSFKNSLLPKTLSPIGVPNDNCSTRANTALDAAGIPMVDSLGKPLFFPWQIPAPRGLPGTAGDRADVAGAVPYLIPQGSSRLPPYLNQFNPH